MKKKIILIVCLLMLFLHTSHVHASSILPFKYSELGSSSQIIVLGKVVTAKLTQDPERPWTRLDMIVEIVSMLKGKANKKSFSLELHVGGLKGFDIKLEEGDLAVFFLEFIKEGKGQLVYPGTVARFKKGMFID